MKLALAVSALIFGSVAAISTPASAADNPPLIDVTPAETIVAVPAPGHSTAWDITVTNVTTESTPLTLDVDADDSALFGGDHPLTLSVTDQSGIGVLADAPVGDLIGHGVDLPNLAAGATYTVHGTIALPRDAGNSYQGQSADLTLRITATGDDGSPTSPGGGLASTGSDIVVYVAIGAGALLLGFLILFLAAQRRRKERES